MTLNSDLSPAVAPATSPVWPIIFAAALLVALVAVPPLLFGFQPPYYRYPDPDLILAYHGLIMADGLPQEFFDHTGYTYLLALACWNQALHAVGFLPVHTLSNLAAIKDPVAYDAAWTAIIQAGRAMMVVTAIAVVLIFAALVGWWRRDWRLGFLAGALLAGAAGTMSQLYVLRTELLSSFLVVATLLLSLIASREKTIGRSLILLGMAGFCAVVAISTKVLAAVPLLAIPALLLVLIDPPGTDRRRHGDLGKGLAAIVIAAGIISLALATAVVYHAVTNSGSAYTYKPFAFGHLGVYQPIVGIYVAAAMWIYSIRQALVPRTALAGMAALGIGLALGVFVFCIKYDARNVIAAVNPIEHMFVFSTWKFEDVAAQSNVLGGPIVELLTKGFGQVLKEHLGLSTPKNTVVLEWFTMLGIILGLRDRSYWMVQALALLAVGWIIQSIFYFRIPLLWYFAYSDPFVVLAAIIVAERWLPVLRFTRMRLAACAVMGLYLALGYALMHKSYSLSDPKPQCVWMDRVFTRLPPFAFCRT
jgi:hypothetical protein